MSEMHEPWEKYRLSTKAVIQLFAIVFIGNLIGHVGIDWPSTAGIGADSEGRVYIGDDYWIAVYEDGELVDKLVRSVAGEFYEFTIIDDQIHVWDTSDYRKIYDLEGNEVDRWYEFSPGAEFTNREKRQYVAEDGRFYKLENGLLERGKIICYFPDGREEVVYQMPVRMYLSKLIYTIHWPLLAVWIGEQIRQRVDLQTRKKYWRA